jgi:hypothetical protein
LAVAKQSLCLGLDVIVPASLSTHIDKVALDPKSRKPCLENFFSEIAVLICPSCRTDQGDIGLDLFPMNDRASDFGSFCWKVRD